MRATIAFALFATSIVALPVQGEEPKLPPGALAILGAADEQKIEKLQGQSMQFSADGKYLWVHRFARISLIDLQSFKTVWEFDPPPRQRWAQLHVSPDGRAFATVRFDRLIQIWDSVTRNELASIPLEDRNRQVSFFTFVSNTLLLVAISDGESSPGYQYLWDLTTKTEVKRKAWHSDKDWWRASMTLPDGEGELRVVMPNMATTIVRIFNAHEKEQMRAWDRPILGLSQDGRFLATHSEVGIESVPQSQIRPQWLRLNPKAFAVTIFDLRQERIYSKIPSCMVRTENFFVNAASGVQFHPNDRSCLTITPLGGIQCWELASGQERFSLPGTAKVNFAVTASISPDGRLFATIGPAGIIVWSFEKIAGQSGPEQLSRTKLQSLWEEFTAYDARKSYAAMCKLAACPNAPPFIAEVAPRKTELSSRVNKAIGNLGAAQFSTREQATADLIGVGDAARVTLNLELAKDNVSAEAARRIRQILAKLQPRIVGPASLDELHAARVAELLELIGSKDARELLKKYAADFGGEPLGREAKESLGRNQRLSKNE
jgi:hypothetical protein